MPREATILREGAPDDAAGITRAPGQFARNYQGAPWVADPAATSKHTGNKAQLIELCAKRGIAVPPKVTVAQLHELLGPRPKRVLYGRPSSLGKQIENTTNLQKWSERAVALGIYLDVCDYDANRVDDPMLVPIDGLSLEQRTLDDPDAKDVLDAIAVKAKNRARAGIAAERGTHGHELTEDHDNEQDFVERVTRGEDLGLPSEVQYALVAAWAKMLGQLDVEMLAVEATCVDDHWRQAGTLDRICRLKADTRFPTVGGTYVTLPAGWVGILDIKTGRLRLDDAGFVSYWHGYSVQLASYAQSVPYDPDTDTRGEWPWPVDQQWAIIAHLDILAALDGEAKCRLVLVDLEAGREAGAHCVWARSWEKRTDVFSLPTDDLCVSVPVEGFTTGRTDPAISVADAQVTDTEVAVAPPGTSVSTAGEEEDHVLDSPASTAAQADAQPDPAAAAAGSTVAIVCSRGGGCQTVVLPAAPSSPDVEQPAEEAPPAAASAEIAACEDPQVLAADTQPAPGAAAPGANMSDDEARAAYAALDDDTKREVCRLRDEHIRTEYYAGRVVSKAQATKLALGWVAPFDVELPPQPAAPLACLPERVVRFTGDEGAELLEAEALEARGWMESLMNTDAEAFAAVRLVAKQADDAGVGFHILVKSTRRRWEIYRGLACCARYGWSDEVVRELLAAARGDDACLQPAVPLGQIVGLLDAAQAASFAHMASQLTSAPERVLVGAAT